MSMDKQIKKNKWSFKRIAIYLGVVAGIAILFAAIYRDAGVSRLNVESERLLTDTINRAVFKEYITLFGAVEPIKTVYIDAIESGRIEQIYVEDGAIVDAGQEIMRLSNLDLQLNVLNQEAQIVNQINTIRNQSILMEQQSLNLREQALSVEYQIDLFEKRNDRNQKLYADAVISQVDFEETEDQLENFLRRREMLKATLAKDSLYHAMQSSQMETTLDLMQRNLKIAKSSLGNLIIRAPIYGQLSSLDSEVGELISRGDRIAQIDVQDDFKIRASIDEFYLRRVFPQQEANFTMDGRNFTLQIKKIYPTVTNGAFEVDMVFTSDRPNNIKRGQTISLKLSLSDETEAMLLAKGGFYQATGGNWVYVIDPATGNARKRDIKIGRQNPNYYEVQQGLQVGDIVIISNYENFGDKDELVLK